MGGRYLSGSIWSGLNALVATVVPLGVFVFFAKHMPSWQVGVLAYGLACAELVKALAPLGLYEALLAADDYEELAAPANTLLLAWSGLALLLYASVIGLSTTWMGDIIQVWPFVLALGIRIIFDMAAIQPQVTIARRMDFRRLATRTLAGNSAAALAGIALGLTISPLWGLTSYYILQSLVVWLTTIVGTGANTRLSGRWSGLKRIAGATFVATQVRSLGTVNNFADQAIAGAFVSPALLAHYNLGKRVEVAQFTASQSFVSILFQPLFARRADHDLADDYRRSLTMMTVLCGIPTAFFIANAQLLINAAFGPSWHGAVPVVIALAISGFARAIGGVHAAYFSVTGQNHLLRNRTVLSAIGGLLVVIFTGQIGIIWVAGLIAFKNILMTAWSAFMTRRLAAELYYLRDVLGMFAVAFAGAWAGSGFTARLIPYTSLVLSLAASSAAMCAFLAIAYGNRLARLALSYRRA